MNFHKLPLTFKLLPLLSSSLLHRQLESRGEAKEGFVNVAPLTIAFSPRHASYRVENYCCEELTEEIQDPHIVLR